MTARSIQRVLSVFFVLCGLYTTMMAHAQDVLFERSIRGNDPFGNPSRQVFADGFRFTAAMPDRGLAFVGTCRTALDSFFCGGRIDSQGRTLWAFELETDSLASAGESVVVDGNGDLLFAGTCRRPPQGVAVLCVTKRRSDGELLWVSYGPALRVRSAFFVGFPITVESDRAGGAFILASCAKDEPSNCVVRFSDRGELVFAQAIGVPQAYQVLASQLMVFADGQVAIGAICLPLGQSPISIKGCVLLLNERSGELNTPVLASELGSFNVVVAQSRDDEVVLAASCNTGTRSWCLAKVGTDGSIKWSTRVREDVGYSEDLVLTVDSKGDILLAGQCEPSLSPKTCYSKVSGSTGQSMWDTVGARAPLSNSWQVKVDADDNLLEFVAVCPTQPLQCDSQVSKFDGSNGELLWKTTLAGQIFGVRSVQLVDKAIYVSRIGAEVGAVTVTKLRNLPGGPNDDFDGDGVTNGTEIALGFDPAIKDNDIFANTPLGTKLFVMQQYRDLLRREATEAELATGEAALASGQSKAAFIESLMMSPASADLAGPVARLYQAYFLRRPDTGGFDFWMDAYRKRDPWTFIAISNFFATSNEFRQRYGALNNEQFVTLIYNNILNRAPDSTGLSFWLSELTDGRRSRGQVMADFSESPENKLKTKGWVQVVTAYTRMLQQEGDEATLAQWVPVANAGGSLQPLIEQLMARAEYRARFLP